MRLWRDGKIRRSAFVVADAALLTRPDGIIILQFVEL